MKKIIVVLSLLVCVVFGDNIKVFAASSTKLAMDEIVSEFKRLHNDTDIVVTYTATGKAYAQFTHGFDYDIFIAADTMYPEKIVSDGNAISEPQTYAMGVVALFSHDETLLKEGIEVIGSDKVKHVAIANPRLAPYGVAALEILENYDLKEAAKTKLVLGDNIAQSVQFVDSGAAEIGLVAFSLIKSTKKPTEYQLIDQKKYSPMKQAFVLTKYAKDKPLAQKFGEFLLSSFAQNSFEKYGFGSVE